MTAYLENIYIIAKEMAVEGISLDDIENKLHNAVEEIMYDLRFPDEEE